MKFYQTDWFLRVISVLIAIVIWIYVVYEYNPQYETWVRDVPITYLNRSQEFENGKMAILDTSTDQMDIKIRGRRRLVSAIDASNTTVTVDMAGITKEGTYTLPINVHFAADGVEVLQKKPYTQEMVIDRVITEEREITVDTEGQLPAGYVVDSGTNSPETVKLTGPQSIIGNVAKCSIAVNFTDVSDDIKGLYKIKLYDAQNNAIESEFISKNIEYTEVYYAVLATKTVPVTPKLSAARTADGLAVTAAAQPAQVTIKGKAPVLDAISVLETTEIDISGVNQNRQVTAALELPGGVTMADQSEAAVTVSLTVASQQ